MVSLLYGFIVELFHGCMVALLHDFMVSREGGEIAPANHPAGAGLCTGTGLSTSWLGGDGRGGGREEECGVFGGGADWGGVRVE
jgi:hypothetical protein